MKTSEIKELSTTDLLERIDTERTMLVRMKLNHAITPLDNPQKIGSALFWVRSLINPLLEAPYNYPPEDMNLVVVIHGTEIVTVAKKNEAKYREAVDRMRYYAGLGVAFKVCGQAAEDYGYAVADFQDFIEVVPNAITELAHWQQQGYALITPQILDKRIDIESIR